MSGDVPIRALNGEEIRVISETGAAKGTKPQRYDLIPTLPLKLLAEQYGKGADKYEPVNGKDNWRSGYPWSQSYTALQRHANAFWSGEEMDDHDKDCAEGCQEHSGAPHLIAAAWHCFTLTQWMQDPKLRAQFDDRQDDA